MVLANALYFKAEWQHQFNPNSTINQIFFVNENEQREVEMMSINGRFLYAEDAAVQVIGLPYKNDEVFMYIFLPKEMYGLDDFLSTMTGEQLIGTLEFSMRIENVEVSSKYSIVQIP
ncbi:unnamed protein product [Toxocara canis]|uniref:SERPIN domain-containing protein n=1 Tax=Toxocara canis TaxID=6265 RepID=A0A183U729_TOXCA|nr:unnamed protein product [Toxocara canis]